MAVHSSPNVLLVMTDQERYSPPYEDRDLAEFRRSQLVTREPHGPALGDTGLVRDSLLADQVCDLFGRLQSSDDGSPWLVVASFVNPHDIAFSGLGQQLLGFPEPDHTVPDVPPAPSQDDAL